jgi:hypothetical protein
MKNLAPYLPYDLKFLYHGNIYKMRWINRFGDIDYDSQIDFIEPFPPNIFNKELDLVKLIFRPLSDLTKEIEVNGERFYPLEKLTEIFGGRPISFDGNCFYTKIQESVVRKKEDAVPLHFSQLDAFNKLFEWHFDVFGLIENGLAIDINTL